MASIAPYLAELGISHVYFSPVLQAAPGSTHGYDVADPTRLSDDLGGAAAYERACDALAEYGIGQMWDIVPNHMAVSETNPWWWDVLRNGRGSEYAAFFDLRWQPGAKGSPEYIRLPVLGSDLESVLAKGELRLTMEEGEPILRYYGARFPLSPETAPNSGIEAYSLNSGLLLELLERQHYRLVYWRTASSFIDYRRFFDINGLVGARVEEPTEFKAAHQVVLEQVAAAAGAGPAHRPHRRPARPAGVPLPAAQRRAERPHPGREDPRRRRAATTALADRRHHGLRLPLDREQPVR